MLIKTIKTYNTICRYISWAQFTSPRATLINRPTGLLSIQSTIKAVHGGGAGASSEIAHKTHKSAPATFQGPCLTSKSATDAVLEISDGKVSRWATVVAAARLHDACKRVRSESSLGCEMRFAIAFLFVVSANYVKSVNGGCSLFANGCYLWFI